MRTISPLPPAWELWISHEQQNLYIIPGYSVERLSFINHSWATQHPLALPHPRKSESLGQGGSYADTGAPPLNGWPNKERSHAKTWRQRRCGRFYGVLPWETTMATTCTPLHHWTVQQSSTIGTLAGNWQPTDLNLHLTIVGIDHELTHIDHQHLTIVGIDHELTYIDHSSNLDPQTTTLQRTFNTWASDDCIMASADRQNSPGWINPHIISSWDQSRPPTRAHA